PRRRKRQRSRRRSPRIRRGRVPVAVLPREVSELLRRGKGEPAADWLARVRAGLPPATQMNPASVEALAHAINGPLGAERVHEDSEAYVAFWRDLACCLPESALARAT